MRGRFGGDGAPAGCRCTVCSSHSGEDAICRRDEGLRVLHSLFTDGELGSTYDNYASLMKSSNGQDFIVVEETVDPKFLKSACGGIVEFEHPMSSSAKVMVVLAVLLATVLVAFIIFAVLTYEGVINIPGVDSEALRDVTKWVGTALCTASLAYLMLALGYALGCRTGGDDKRYEAELDCYKSRIDKCFSTKLRLLLNLHRSSKELESHISGLKPEDRYGPIQRLRESHLHASSFHSGSAVSLERHRLAIQEMRAANELKRSESAALTEENARLSTENDTLRSRLDALN